MKIQIYTYVCSYKTGLPIFPSKCFHSLNFVFYKLFVLFYFFVIVFFHIRYTTTTQTTTYARREFPPAFWGITHSLICLITSLYCCFCCYNCSRLCRRRRFVVILLCCVVLILIMASFAVYFLFIKYLALAVDTQLQ